MIYHKGWQYWIRVCLKDIARHEGDYEGTKYLVWWYGYGSAEEVWEPSHHIPHHFICRYWDSQLLVAKQSPRVEAQNWEEDSPGQKFGKVL